MKEWEKWASGAGLAFCALLAWFSGVWLQLRGSSLWVFRAGIMALGVAGLGGWRAWRQKGTEGDSLTNGPSATGPAAGERIVDLDQIDALVAEAETALRSQSAAGIRRIADAPLMLVVGTAKSRTTDVLLNSGLDAHLLSGQSKQAEASGEAKANIWFSQRRIFLEASESIFLEPKSWTRLIRHVVPGRFRSLASRSAELPRAVLVCLDVNEVLKAKPGGAATAQMIRKSLKDVCNILGVQLPVYVVFTNIDQIKFFADYSLNLTIEEANRPFGATMTIDRQKGTEVWQDWQAARAKRAFDGLCQSLSARCLDLLSLESDQLRRRGIYQFPREFRKLLQQGSLINFLVDLCRPFQLGTSPFLRGFYFTGLRQSAEQAAYPSAERSPSPRLDDTDFSSTRVVQGGLGDPDLSASRSSSGPSVVTRTQWLFLPRLFSEVLLQDGAAAHASAPSLRVGFRKRIALALGIFTLACFSLSAVVSYFSNRHLIEMASSASASLARADLRSGTISQNDLQQLDALRQLLVQLASWRNGREHLPWHIRWGLYTGNDLFPAVRKTYFNQFDRLMLARIRTAWHDSLLGLRNSPQSEQGFSPTYQTLKAYLIITSRPEKSTPQFLTPMLLGSWDQGHSVGEERRQLARNQFDFFSVEQGTHPPYQARDEDDAVAQGRLYLEGFTGAERVYQSMLNQAGAHGSAINFNRQFPGSAEALVDGYEVPAAYTKAGWAEMKILFQNSGGFLPTENWVVEVPQAERARVQQELPSRYQHEFISQWSQFLQSAQVVPYRRPPEAAKKLALLSGSQSPLLELFCLTAQNVSVDSPQVTSAFQAVLSVVPPNCSIRYTGDPNNDYVTALFSLQQRFQELASNPTSGDAHAQLDPNITSAKSAVHQMETRFAIDPEWQIHTTVAKLLYDPITKAEQSIPNGADASAVCAEFSRLKSKYPFDPKGSDASLQEFEAFFQPKGVLWTFVEQNLRGLVAVAGNQYSGTGTKPIRPEFLQFLNRAAQVRDALYKTGGQRPEFRYSLRAYPSEGLKNVTLIIDGQTLQYESTKGDLKNFVWPANGQGAERQTELIGGTQLPPLELKGPWGIYRLLGDMQWNPQIGSERILEWTIRERQSDGPLLFNGKPITLRFGLSLEGPDIFQPGFLSGLNCISRVVQ